MIPQSKEIPQFTHPREEASFLREHVRETAEQLHENGEENALEKSAEDTLRAYKEIPHEEVIVPENIIEEKEVESITLNLSAEAHDETMGELLHILQERGIKNTLSIVEEMNNPHIEDDFHRFLVQYLQEMDEIPGLKEKHPIFKGLSMKLFEVSLPSTKGEDGPGGFKEFISAMEQFYIGMKSVSKVKRGPQYFTLEIALAENSDEVVVYSAVPIEVSDLFEKQVLAFYEDAKLREVTDDYNIFGENAHMASSVARLEEPDVLSIKTHENIDHDPFSTLLGAFSKLKREGEGAAFQMVVSVPSENMNDKYSKVLKEVQKGETVKKAMELLSKFDHTFIKATKELIFGSSSIVSDEDDKHKDVDSQAVEIITSKVSHPILSAEIRLITSATDRSRAESILGTLESVFHQFDNVAGGNNIKFARTSPKSEKSMLRDFSFRLISPSRQMYLNTRELATLFHYPVGISSSPQLRESKSSIAPAPIELQGNTQGIELGLNSYRGIDTRIHMSEKDRMRHFYVLGQTGTGKTTIMKNMIAQDIANGDGCCYIDPHGTDIQDILSYIPKERMNDVIYFDPAYTARPMGLNMLEYDVNYPEQKTFVINELIGIFNKLFDMKAAGGPMFEQYFRNSAMLTMEHPESGSTLLEIGRVLSDKSFRDMKLRHCSNPIIRQFWENAEKTTGDAGLENFVPYITNKFDVFISNDIMRPVIAQQHSVFNFRKIMDEKKILLVNLAKGRLGDINANLIGLILVGKIQMAALSRVDMYGQEMAPFYLYIDEFQNVTTDSIASILSEARKYNLSLNIAHQYIAQLQEPIRDAVFGNVGSMAIFRVSVDDAQFLESKFSPTFSAKDLMQIDNWNAYMSLLSNGSPTKPFNMATSMPPQGDKEIVEKLKELSYYTYGRDRDMVEKEILSRYNI
ncbi:MAG: hypothetical protein ACI9AR_000611 [Flavobacteriaceae bacterium]|jgi:hypothetical protein